MDRLISLYDVERILLDTIAINGEEIKEEDFINALDEMENLPSYELEDL